jgi:hypothetical protein
MHSVLDILRGPALGVIFVIMALAGVVVVTAFAALIAQVGLLIRLRPWQQQAVAKAQHEPEASHRYSPQRSPSRSVRELEEIEVVDADWWYIPQ